MLAITANTTTSSDYSAVMIAMMLMMMMMTMAMMMMMLMMMLVMVRLMMIASRSKRKWPFNTIIEDTLIVHETPTEHVGQWFASHLHPCSTTALLNGAMSFNIDEENHVTRSVPTHYNNKKRCRVRGYLSLKPNRCSLAAHGPP